MIILEDCVKKLERFKSQFGESFGIRKLGIFGSVARRENGEDSDIDIMVDLEVPSLSLMYELEQSLGELFPCSIDLVRWRGSLRPLFRRNILNDLILI